MLKRFLQRARSWLLQKQGKLLYSFTLVKEKLTFFSKCKFILYEFDAHFNINLHIVNIIYDYKYI